MIAPWIPSEPFLAGLPSLMRLATLPGLSMAVTTNRALSWSRAFGVLNARTGAPVRESTLFEAASMSKPVFAYVVLQLVDQGRIELDRPLVSYYRPPYLPQDARIGQITARHVLTHSTGLPDWGDPAAPDTLRPMFLPGSRFSYSGEGFFWLQLVTERVTGVGLDALVRKQLFEPAQMSASTFAWDTEHAAQASFGHQRGGVAPQDRREMAERVAGVAARWGVPIRDWNHEQWLLALQEISPRNPRRLRVSYVNSAASLLTTAADYARFLQLLMDHRTRASWEISEAARLRTITPQMPVQQSASLWWSLGWAIQRSGESWRVSHEGNNDNRFTSFAGLDPEQGVGLVILTNGGSGYRLYQRIVREVTGLDQLSFITHVTPPISS